jgi:hypothetical protein
MKNNLFPYFNTPNEKGGFFDLPNKKMCNHPEHNPPTHLHIPQGKGYKHLCPACKKSTIVIPPQITF